MKKTILAITLVFTVLISCKKEEKVPKTLNKAELKKEVVTTQSKKLIRNINTSVSVMNWIGTKPTGKHNGTVKFKSGKLVMNGDALKSGEFVIDLSTLSNSDLKDATYKAKLERHLKSPEFFDVATYPTAKFVITNIVEKDGKLAVTGNLTIKDVTKEIVIPTTLTKEGKSVVFKSDNFKINRADFNVKYMSKKFFKNLKDKFIDDEITLSFKIKA